MSASSPRKSRRTKGRHRVARAEPTTVQWLRVGALTVGVGAAVVTGQGIANASPGTTVADSVNVNEEEETAASGSDELTDTDSGGAATDAPTLVSEAEATVDDNPVSDAQVPSTIPSETSEPQVSTSQNEVETDGDDGLSLSPLADGAIEGCNLRFADVLEPFSMIIYLRLQIF